jgi:UDP-N-acetylmuramate--alanine ligase
VVSQTHTYSRTSELFDDFVTAYKGADIVYLLPIYAAREENTYGVTSEQLAEAITKAGTPATVFQTIPAVALAVRELLEDGVPSVVVTIGAGEVTKVADLLIHE